MGGFAVVLAAMMLGAAVVPGVVAEPREDVRPSYFDIRDDDGSIRPVSVSGSTATLQIETRIRHDGGDAENVSVVVRAIDSQTGLLEDRRETDLGTLEGTREVPVLSNLTVERAGGYDIEVFVYEDGIGKASERASVSGVGALTPEYAQSPVKFHDFQSTGADLSSMEVGIASVQNDRATLNVSTYLKNEGDQDAGDVTLALSARQADSNVVADKTRIEVGSIRPGRTVPAAAELTVPDEYNYWLDAILLKDGVVVDTVSEPANLDPQRTLEKDERQTEVGFQSDEFTGDGPERDQATETPIPTGGSGPGFGPAAALAAAVGAALLAVRRTR